MKREDGDQDMQDAAVEAADLLEGVDQEAAAASVPENKEAAGNLPAGVSVKREPEEDLVERQAKRIKQEL